MLVLNACKGIRYGDSGDLLGHDFPTTAHDSRRHASHGAELHMPLLLGFTRARREQQSESRRSCEEVFLGLI